MNLVSEVEHAGPERKIDHITLGREHKYAVFKNIQLQVFKELLIAGYRALHI